MEGKTPEERCQELGIEFIPPKPSIGLYKPVVVVGNFAYTSGQVPVMPDHSVLMGKVGADVDLAGGQAAAKQCAVTMLSQLKHNLGSLNKIKRVVKVMAFVNCSPDFTQQPAVINGFSEVLRDIWGEENGIGARSAVGTNALPLNATVEIEGIFELHQAQGNL